MIFKKCPELCVSGGCLFDAGPRALEAKAIQIDRPSSLNASRTSSGNALGSQGAESGTRSHRQKHELLKVLERPEIPLHTNHERERSCGQRRHDPDNEDLCKLGISFFAYSGDRLGLNGTAERIPATRSGGRTTSVTSQRPESAQLHEPHALLTSSYNGALILTPALHV
jgi:hypothetical protein